jgi:hypothetical protein
MSDLSYLNQLLGAFFCSSASVPFLHLYSSFAALPHMPLLGLAFFP